MNKKRWMAIVIAAVLLAFSIGINAVMSLFTSNFLSDLDSSLMAQDEQMETVLEDGDTQKRIAYLEVNGAIQDLGSDTLLQTVGYDHQAFLQQLDAVLADQTVAGIVLKVDSPGGGVVESAEIYDKLIEIKKTRNIPIYVSMGSLAASGGYYIAAPADKIIAHKETITGSIGVIMQSLNYKDLADDLGVKYETFKSGAHKDMLSPTRDVTKEERAMLQEMINESYEEFVDVIEAGRGMSEADVKKVADGRILSATQAKRAGLVDEIANTEDAIMQLRTDFDLKDAELFEYASGMEDWKSLLGVKINSWFGPSLEEQMLVKLMTDYRTPKMMYLYGE